jgi:hypothetical protein
MYFCQFLYAKGMLNAKTCECNFLCLLSFFMPPQYGVHGALKNAKAENIFMMIFSMQV